MKVPNELNYKKDIIFNLMSYSKKNKNLINNCYNNVGTNISLINYFL